MKLKKVDALQPGEKLGKALLNDDGKVLLKEGVALSSRLIKRLKENYIRYVYIEDSKTNDIVVEHALSDETRVKALQTMKQEFNVIKKDENLAASLSAGKVSESFTNVVDMVLTDVKGHGEAVSLLSDVILFDSYVFSHSLQVTIYSLRLAMELGYSDKQLREIGLGAILHDVGKMKIPEEILNKPGKLTDDEFEKVKKHAENGYYILKDVPNMPLLAAHCAFQHHERLDGSGYPRGITEKEMHDYAKIIAVADVFDAVTSHRVYRSAMLPHQGLEILYSGAGTLFDYDMVVAFQKVVALYPPGMKVELSDGSKGVVVKQNKNLSNRPIVRITEKNNEDISESYDMDLLYKTNITITGCETYEDITD
ncbi:HD-GYP domain-containing protein [Salibacterium salarium]|uniref:HD-GYP domain-containing protein n=1 Tax=Salibacterium salarium TaxID=284579 RepID=A0A3R9R9L7_9BACI|nr:HD-GYP domain-containing protein [Salibacterium salarium]RSL30349.1 HD-GYP domain-containing protein [Salibacterium salarium]